MPTARLTGCLRHSREQISTTRLTQVLRDEIGTAMTNINSRADQFSLIIHSQEGEGSPKRDSSRKGVQMYVGHTGVSQSDARISCASNGASRSNCQRKSLILGFPVLQVVLPGQV